MSDVFLTGFIVLMETGALYMYAYAVDSLLHVGHDGDICLVCISVHRGVHACIVDSIVIVFVMDVMCDWEYECMHQVCFDVCMY